MARAKAAGPTAETKHRHAFYARLKAIGAEYCGGCNAYMFTTHTCQAFAITNAAPAYRYTGDGLGTWVKITDAERAA